MMYVLFVLFAVGMTFFVPTLARKLIQPYLLVPCTVYWFTIFYFVLFN